jgi:hypothetical protein
MLSTISSQAAIVATSLAILGPHARVASPDADARGPGTDSSVVVASGTRLTARLTRAIETRSARSGDVLEMRVAFPVRQSGRVVLPAGTVVHAILDSTSREPDGAALFVHLASVTFANGYVLSPGAPARLTTIRGSVEQRPAPGVGRAATAAVPIAGMGIGAAVGGASGAVTGGAIAAAVDLVASIGMRHSTSDVFVADGADMDLTTGSDVVVDPARVPAESDAHLPTARCYDAADVGTPDTVVPGIPGTPAIGTDPGTPGTPDVLIPGTPGRPGRWVDCRE